MSGCKRTYMLVFIVVFKTMHAIILKSTGAGMTLTR